MFLEARHLFSRLYCTIYLEKKGLSRILSNMKAYVIVGGLGSVANIRNIVDQKLFTFSVANDLVRADRLFLIISFG